MDAQGERSAILLDFFESGASGSKIVGEGVLLVVC